MTNRKLKLAAMSVALTACVAAQPMAAHAVEGPDANADDTATPQAGPTAMDPVDDTGSTAPDATDGEEEKQEEFTPPVNEEAKEEEQAPAFGPGTSTDDITIDYKPAEKPEEPGDAGDAGDAGDTGNTGDAGDAGNTGDTGDAGDTDDTDDTRKPDGTYMEGDVIDNSKKDEATGEDGQVIGSATKEETPESSSSTTVVDPDAEVKKGESVVGKDEDGNTTITTPTETTGTETTTTTGTGKADSSTTITDTKETEKGDKIDLDDELGKDVRPDWKTDKGAQLGDYTVEEVTPTEGDPNSKDLTLKKTENAEKKMSAEDIAKLLDVSKDGVEKKTDDEGNTTYTLTKTEISTDENGNTVTRTTYYEITGNSVKTRTETTLKLKVEKGTAKGEQNVDTEIKLPSITANKTSGNSKKDTIEISAKELEDMLHDSSTIKNGDVYTYVKEENGKKYTYTITKTDVKSGDYTYEDIAKLLGSDYIYDKDGVYYKDKSNKLSITDMDAVHKTLSYKVDVIEESYLDQDDGHKDSAAEAAKLEAIRKALKEAAKSANINTEDLRFQAELDKILKAKDGTFVYMDSNGHKFTFNYTVDATVTTDSKKADDTTVPGKNPDDIKDVKDNTVTGTAYVTSGSESWSQTETIAGSGSILGNDYTKLPTGVAEDQVERENNDPNGRITKITIGNDVYTFEYDDNATLTDEERAKLVQDAAAKGLTLDIENLTLTSVKWTKKTTTTTTDTKSDSNKTGSVSEKDNTIVEVKSTDKDGKENISYTITVGDKTYEGFTKSADGMTYTKIEGKKTTTITVTTDTLEDDDIKALLAKKYGVKKDSITLNDDGTASWSTGDNTTVTVSYTDITQKLTVTETTTDSVNKTELDDLIAAVQDKVDKLENGDQLTLKGKTTYTITKDANGNLSMKNNLGEVVEGTANVNQRLIDVITTIATNYIDYDSLKPEDIWNLLDQQQGYADGGKSDSNPGGCDSYWPEQGYENNAGEWKNGQWVAKKDKDGNIIGETPAYGTTHFDHLGLDADVDITTNDGTVINGLLLSDGLTFTYGRKEQIAGYVDMDKYPDKNYNGSQYYDNKDELHKTTGALDAKLNTDVKETTGKFWNGTSYENNPKLTYTYLGEGADSNAFSGKRFYKITGKVAYNKTDEVTLEEEAQNLVEILKTMQGKKDARYVAVKLQNNTTVYYVYSDVADIEAIGYMTASANTSANQDVGNWHPGEKYYYGPTNPGDYDLRIQGLKLVNGKVQGNYGIDYSLGMELIHNAGSESNGTLNVSDYTTTTTVTNTKTDPGTDKYGSYNASYTRDYEWKKDTESEVKGEGNGSYKTFTEILKNIFSGKGESSYDEGSVSYTHRTTDADKLETSAVSKTTETKTDAHVDYDYTTIETRKVTVSGEETVIVPPVDPDTPDEPETPEIPDTPGTPVQDETPDEVVVTPENPELPPVQDATPDEAVTPANPELPAVQDATALPQTGVNWFTALGMAFSGMLLMIAGAFTSLKYKEKH